MKGVLKFYQCIKQVHAEPMPYGEFKTTIRNVKDLGTIHFEEPGYHVVYNRGTQDEYHSWSPKAVFEEGYIEIPPGTSKPGSKQKVKLS